MQNIIIAMARVAPKLLWQTWHSLMLSCTPSSCLQKYKEARVRFEALLARVGAPGQLHRWHVHAFDCLTPLMNACRATGDPAGSLNHANAVVAGIEAVQGPVPSVELGNYLELIGQVSGQITIPCTCRSGIW